MVHLFCDPGIKNFCYVIFDKCHNSIIDYKLIDLTKNYFDNLLNLLKELNNIYQLKSIHVEHQYYNKKCANIQLICKVYAALNNINYHCISPSLKFKRLNKIYNIPIPKTKTERKKFASNYNSKLLTENQINDINTWKKKDDIYDVILMIETDIIIK